MDICPKMGTVMIRDLDLDLDWNLSLSSCNGNSFYAVQMYYNPDAQGHYASQFPSGGQGFLYNVAIRFRVQIRVHIRIHVRQCK